MKRMQLHFTHEATIMDVLQFSQEDCRTQLDDQQRLLRMANIALGGSTYALAGAIADDCS